MSLNRPDGVPVETTATKIAIVKGLKQVAESPSSTLFYLGIAAYLVGSMLGVTFNYGFFIALAVLGTISVTRFALAKLYE